MGRHEVTNNWSASKDLTADARYSEKNVPLLIARARGHFSTTRRCGRSTYANRSASTGDTATARSSTCSCSTCGLYRGPNSANLQSAPSDATAFLGREQLDWLKAGLKNSRLQFFGEVNIRRYSADLTVDLRDINGLSVFSKTLQPHWD